MGLEEKTEVVGKEEFVCSVPDKETKVVVYVRKNRMYLHSMVLCPYFLHNGKCRLQNTCGHFH